MKGVEDEFAGNIEEIKDFADDIPKDLDEILQETVLAREAALRNVTDTFKVKLQEIAGDFKCKEACVDICDDYANFPGIMDCVSRNCECDPPINFSVTEYFEVRPKSEVNLVSCSVNANKQVFCAGSNQLILASEDSSSTEVKASFKFDTYTITLICVFAA